MQFQVKSQPHSETSGLFWSINYTTEFILTQGKDAGQSHSPAQVWKLALS